MTYYPIYIYARDRILILGWWIFSLPFSGDTQDTQGLWQVVS